MSDEETQRPAQVDQLVAALNEPLIKQRLNVLLQAAVDYVDALCGHGLPIDDAMASATGALTSSFAQILLRAGSQNRD